MENQKYHHLIPATYLKSWCYYANSIYVMNKHSNSIIEIKNIYNIAGIKNYHTIKAGMPCCSQENLKNIFSNGKILKTLKEYNAKYYDFNSWKIYGSNGNLISNKSLKHEIEQIKILDIEDLWDQKYEKKWSKLLNITKQRISNTQTNEIETFYKGLLMKFIVALNLRGFKGNELLEETLSKVTEGIGLEKIEIPLNERIKPLYISVFEESKNNTLLVQFNEFLHERGSMYEMAKQYIKDLTVEFYVSSGSSCFITSDNPSFKFTENNESIHIMPFSPKILACLSRDRSKTQIYYIKEANNRMVEKFNKIILNNRYEYIFLKTKNTNIR